MSDGVFFALHCHSLDGKSLGADRCPNSKPRLLPSSAGTREAAMIVKNILLGKGGNVVTIEPTTRELAVAQEALTTASRHRDVCQAEYDAAEIALEAALDGSGLGR